MRRQILMTSLGILLLLLSFISLLLYGLIYFLYQQGAYIPNLLGSYYDYFFFLLLTEILFFPGVILLFRKKIVPFIQHHTISTIVFFICVLILSLVTENIYIFDGVNTVGLNCGSVQIGISSTENAQVYNTGQCLSHAFSMCIPAHARYSDMGVDISSQQTISVTRRKSQCVLVDTNTKWGMITGQRKSTTVCTGITNSNQQIVLSCKDMAITIP